MHWNKLRVQYDFTALNSKAAALVKRLAVTCFALKTPQSLRRLHHNDEGNIRYTCDIGARL